MKSVAIFCGAKSGDAPGYRESAIALVDALYERNISIVYGGANVGLMKVVADRMLDLGGNITGVFPKSLTKLEALREDLTAIHIVESFRVRKALMDSLSDGFVALSGGLGTLDEIFEMLVYLQLGHHNKPCALLNYQQYYHHLLQFLDHATGEGFISLEHRKEILSAEDPVQLLDAMLQYIEEVS